MAPEKGTGYSSEEMERYFNDPEYRKKKSKSSSRRQMTKRVRRNLIIISVFLLLIATYTVYLFSGLPSLEKIENPKPELATRVYSYDGEILDQFFIKNRSHVSIQEIPKIYSIFGLSMLLSSQRVITELYQRSRSLQNKASGCIILSGTTISGWVITLPPNSAWNCTTSHLK